MFCGLFVWFKAFKRTKKRKRIEYTGSDFFFDNKPTHKHNQT